MLDILKIPLYVTDEHEILKLQRKIQTRLFEIENQRIHFEFIMSNLNNSDTQLLHIHKFEQCTAQKDNECN